MRDFGAFVDIDGMQGLIPYSELAWQRGVDINDYVKLGQNVDVKILNLDWERDRITLSLKSARSDPWENAAEKYPVGSRHVGTVSHLEQFGAFVSLEQGIDGLIHISKIREGKRIKHLREVLAEGEIVEVEVEKLKKEKRRMSLVLIATQQEKRERELEDHLGQFSESPKSPFGSMGDILKEKLRKKDEQD